jgi:hypothetical protein
MLKTTGIGGWLCPRAVMATIEYIQISYVCFDVLRKIGELPNVQWGPHSALKMDNLSL